MPHDSSGTLVESKRSGGEIDSTGAFVPEEIERFSYKFLHVSLVFLKFARNFNQSYEKKKRYSYF